MSFTVKINQIRKILGQDEHFQREKKFRFFGLLFPWFPPLRSPPRKKPSLMGIDTIFILPEIRSRAAASGTGLPTLSY